MEDIKRRYNSMVDLLIFTSNKKILNTTNFVAKLCPLQYTLIFFFFLDNSLRFCLNIDDWPNSSDSFYNLSMGF